MMHNYESDSKVFNLQYYLLYFLVLTIFFRFLHLFILINSTNFINLKELYQYLIKNVIIYD
jgi:hypothetical protein